MNERNQDGYLDRCHADDFLNRIIFEQNLHAPTTEFEDDPTDLRGPGDDDE